jgi:GrpB-like predicted nucleotidyltransferase (UPF0157 family)
VVNGSGAEPEYLLPQVVVDGPIALAEPDPAWAEQFLRERVRIVAALGARALAVEHVGSTSVPGLAAKPIIDVVLVVADSADEEAYVPDLVAARYVLRLRERGWYEHRLLNGLDPAVNLHVFSLGAEEVERMLAFRDLLRRDPGALLHYERTKRRLAAQTWRHTQDYADAKSAVVEELVARARAGRADG